MKISILTTITEPEERQDAWLEAIADYADLADEVIVVNGGSKKLWVDNPIIREFMLPWPDKWGFEEYPKHLNFGLDKVTGDWVLKLDIDQLIHEKDFAEVRKRFEENNHLNAVTFQKMNVLPKKRYTQKGQMLVALNKAKVGNSVCFGDATDQDTDLCQLIVKKGENEKGVPIGPVLANECGRTGISIWNFDYIFKNKEISQSQFFRSAMAYGKYFGKYIWGSTEEDSFNLFIDMMKGRIRKSSYDLNDPQILPKYIRAKYLGLTPDEFGYDGWGLL